MKWLKLAFLIILLLWLLVLPTPVFAATSQTVTITATGIVVDAPGGFTVYYISDYELGITWTKAASANNTMVRAKYGSYPDDRDDGYLVYYGMEVSCSDTAVDLEEIPSTIYYRAWSENTTGVWSPYYAEGLWESVPMTLIALLFIPVILTVAMFGTRNAMLGYPSALFWAIFGGYCYTQSSIPWGDWQFFLFFASAFGMTTFCVLAMFGLRERYDTIAEEEFEKEEGGYFDEGKSGGEEEAEPSSRTKALRDRAAKRRTGEYKRPRRFKW